MTEKFGEPRPAVERHGITFASRETWCDGDLYLPARWSGRLACVVMANGFGGTRDLDVLRYAERFAEQGLAVVALAVSSPAAAAAAARAPRGELRRYPAGHFACFEGRVFELAVADQLAFLDRYVSRGVAP